MVKVVRGRMPFAAWYLNRHQARQALLLPGTVECGEFTANCDNRGRYRVLSKAGTRTAQVGLH